ncbi:hypothetical protein [Sneathiella sp.]|uniref:hypothetical protein n=1 Tax=Sneathiella sp. TaxID=1964365 RepID=UPI002FE0E54A
MNFHPAVLDKVESPVLIRYTVSMGRRREISGKVSDRCALHRLAGRRRPGVKNERAIVKNKDKNATLVINAAPESTRLLGGKFSDGGRIDNFSAAATAMISK